MQATGLLTEEVPCCIVCCCSLRDLSVGHWLDSMYQVGEEDCILQEKYGDIVTDDIWDGVVSKGAPDYLTLQLWAG